MNRMFSFRSRREFLKTSGALTAATVAAPFVLTGRAADLSPGDTIKVGLVGCGGRGTGAAGQALRADSNVQLVAVADAFESQINQSIAALKHSPDTAEKVKVDGT